MANQGLTPQQIEELKVLQNNLPGAASDPWASKMRADMQTVGPPPRSAFWNTGLGRSMDMVGGGFGMLANMAAESISGRSRTPEALPEMTPSVATSGDDVPWDDNLTRGLMSTLGTLSANDPIGYANIMSKWLPGAKVTFDVANNPIISWNGKRYFANKPGISGNDVARLAGDMVSYWPAARWAMAAKSGLGAAVKGGAGAAITNWVQQTAAQMAGSDQDVSIGMMGLAGMAGATSEMMAKFITPSAISLRSMGYKGKLASASGAPTPLGRDFVAAAGVEPETVTAAAWRALDQFYSRLDQAMKTGMTAAVDGAYGRAQAGMAAVPAAADAAAMQAVRGMTAAGTAAEQGALPKTAGQASRNQEQLDLEQLMRTGRYGPAARQTMQGFDQTQRQAVIAQMQRMQDMAAGGSSVATSAAAPAGVVADGTRAAANEAMAGVSAAYDAVPSGVRLAADPLMRVPNAITAALRNRSIFPDRPGFDTVFPRTSAALQSVRQMLAEKAALPPARRSFGLMELEQERRAINQFMNGAEGSDLMALGVIKRQLDEAVDQTWDDALLRGDPMALEQLRAARRARTEYARTFEPENVDATVSNTLRKMIEMPEVDNFQVVNWIFGATEVGFGKAGLQMTRQLQRIFRAQPGPGGEEWNALREAAMMRVLYGTERGNATRDFMWNDAKSPTELAGTIMRRLDNFLDLQGSSVMRVLFNRQELDQLRRFRYELRQIRPGENAQILRTGASLPLWINRVASWMSAALSSTVGGPAGMLARDAIVNAGQSAAESKGARMAAQASSGYTVPMPRSVPIFQSLLTGATMQAAPGAAEAAVQPQR